MPESANRAVPTGKIHYVSHDFVGQSELRCTAQVIHLVDHPAFQKHERRRPKLPDAWAIDDEYRRLAALFDDPPPATQPEETSKPEPAMSQPQQPKLDEVASLRARLWDCGYRPVAVYSVQDGRCGCGDAGTCKSPGKHPHGKDWEERARKDPPEATGKRPAASIQNTGIVCEGLRAVDIDIDDPAPAASVRAVAFQKLGSSLVRWREGSGRCLILYRAAEGKPAKRILAGNLGKIEVLGRGQQFVAFGLHNSGSRLQWSPESPEDTPVSDLPAVFEGQITEFFEGCAELIEADKAAAEKATGAGHTVSATGLEGDLFEVVDALKLIPNKGPADWDFFNRIGMAAWAGTKGSAAGFAAWCHWAKKHPSYDEAVCIERWNHYATSPPTLIGAGTLIHMMREAERAEADRQAEQDRDARNHLEAEPTPLPGRKQEDGVIHDLEVFDAGEDSEDIPPREWLFGAYYALGYFGGLIGDGGVGKTALRYVHYLSMAIGRSLTGDHLFCRSRMLIVCLEDDRDEVRRRMKAAMIQYGISRAELRGWLFYAVPKGIKLVELVDGSPAAGQLEGMIRRAVKRWDINVVSFDPLIKLHSVDENNNSAMDFVADLLTRLASELHIATDTCIHTKKGLVVAGDVDAGRGAGSVKNAGRLMYTATRMTVAEAELFDIGERERLLYIRHDSAKVNLAPPSLTAQWFQLIGIPLGNGNERYPNGDNVQTVELWQPPEMWEGVSIFVANTILDEIENGLPNGSRYSNHHKAAARAACQVVQRHVPEKTEPQARAIIAAWIKKEVLYEEDYLDPTDSKTRKGLRFNVTKRPGTKIET